jgi:riboflavin kinase/FMN adenylyltransferase
LTRTSSAFAPGDRPSLLQTFEQKMDGMRRLGIAQTIVLGFTTELSQMSAEDFLTQFIFGRLDATEVYLGQGFCVRPQPEDGFELLSEVANRLGRVAEEVPEVLVHKHRVSSTYDSQAIWLRAGSTWPARMLGRHMALRVG